MNCLALPCGARHDDASSLSTMSEMEEAPGQENVFAEGGLSRGAIMDKLKRLKARGSSLEEELSILSKIYSHEECSEELLALGARDRGSLRKFIPVILNALLYGYKDVRPTQTEIAAMRRRSNSSRSSEHNIELGATKLLEKNQDMQNLENAVLKQCQLSVDFALNCAWYLQSSLKLGPPELEHRTVSLLLQVEAAVSAEVAASLADDGTQMPDFKNLAGVGDEDLRSWLDIQKNSSDFFHAERDFITCLTDISNDLFNIEKSARLEALRRELERLNDFLPRNVYVPVENRAHRVLRVVPEESVVFSTKERAPYFLTLEVEDFERPKGSSRGVGPPRTQDLLNRPEQTFDFHTKLEGDEARKMANDTSENGGTAVGGAMIQTTEQAGGEHEILQPLKSTNAASKDGLEEAEALQEAATKPHGEESRKNMKTPSGFGELWDQKAQRIRKQSPYGDRPGWRLSAVIVKARDQLRQEMFAQTLISEFAKLFAESRKINLWVRDYRILATSHTSGFIEAIKNSKSIHSIKSSMPSNLGTSTLAVFFERNFGEPSSSSYKRAINNFVVSMAGYAVVSYILQVKDRHNGNIMLDCDGRIIHIDFGFLLSNSPGGNFEFEKAPFKLSNELVEVLGGPTSPAFKKFRKLSRSGYAAVCQTSFANKIMLMVDMMYQGNEDMPCFTRGRQHVLSSLKERFSPNMTNKDRRKKWDRLVAESSRSWTTKYYDMYQKWFTGIN